MTAATSSQTSDAAAFVVLMTREKAEELGVKPIAVLESFAVAGCAPTIWAWAPFMRPPRR